MSIEARIKKAEEKLSIDNELTVVEIVDFSGQPLPPERVDGNRITRFVSYADLIARRQNEC